MAKNIGEIMTYEPAGLVYEGPFNKLIKRNLVLRSLVDKSIAYKIKTTSPRLFLVRPNIGVLPAESSVSVEIYLQPLPCRSPNPSVKLHKFLIVAAEATDDIEDLQEFFKALDPAKVWEGKVICECVMPQPQITNSLMANELDETIRHTAGGVAAVEELIEESYDALEGHELEELQVMKKKVADLEKERLDLTQKIEDMRNTVEIVQKVEKIINYKRPSSLFIIAAAALAIGTVIFATTYGNYVQQLIKQSF